MFLNLFNKIKQKFLKFLKSFLIKIVLKKYNVTKKSELSELTLYLD